MRNPIGTFHQFTFQIDYLICEILNLEICCKQINVHEKVNFRRLRIYVGLHEQFKKSISHVKSHEK